MDTVRKNILKIYGFALGIGGVLYLLIGVLGIHIPCFYYTHLGVRCPGCGISRMFLALSRLDIPAAFGYNPVVFCLLIFWNGVAGLCFFGKPRLLRRPKVLYALLWVTVGILLIWGIARNFH